MKKIIFTACVLVVLILMFWSYAGALEKTSTGFYWPTGKDNFETKNGWWLSKDPDYLPGKYHVGVDMFTYSEKADVYAISDGTIVAVSVNGWGEDNCALAIEHKTDGNSVFVAVYGHLICDTVVKTDNVYASQPIGKTGDYNGIHLHFVIHYGSYSSMAKSGWGMMPISQWTNPCDGNEKCTNGFINPVEFIKNHSPYVKYDEQVTTCSGNICWEPRSKSCEEADSWYRLKGVPYAV